MRVHLAKWGNSTAVRLPKAITDELDLKIGQEIEISVVGGEARLKPLVDDPESRLLERLLSEADAAGWENQPGLEDWSDVEARWPDSEAGEAERQR